MLKRFRPIFENLMKFMLPIAVVPGKLDAVCVSPGWVLISTAVTIIHLDLTPFKLH
jgi:hypothetical protein